jgi:hypothetical protein
MAGRKILCVTTFALIAIFTLFLIRVSYAAPDFSQCDINITQSELPYVISQNDTVYCLNQSAIILGYNATLFAPGVRNSTLNCMYYVLEGNSTDDTYGIFIGNGTSGNVIRNCNITLFNYNHIPRVQLQQQNLQHHCGLYAPGRGASELQRQPFPEREL